MSCLLCEDDVVVFAGSFHIIFLCHMEERGTLWTLPSILLLFINLAMFFIMSGYIHIYSHVCYLIICV